MRRLRLFFVVLVCCSGATGIHGQGTLHVDGRAGTLVAPNIGQMPNISLSPGTYTVEVWHQRYDKSAPQKVTVGASETKSIEFTFKK